MAIVPPNNDTDQYGYLITTEYGRSPLNAYQVKNVSPQVFGGVRTDISFPGNTVTFGSAYSLAVTVGSNAQGTLTTSAVPNGITAGTSLLLTDTTSGATQILVVRNAVSAAATSIDYNAFTGTVARTFPASTTTVAVIVQAGVVAADAAEEEIVAEAPVVAPAAEDAPVDAPVEDEGGADAAVEDADTAKKATRTSKTAK
jgi:hypothetical protein